MAETKEIINLEINFDTALSDAENMKKKVNELKAALDKLGEATETNTAEQQKASQEYIKKNAELKNAQESYKNLEKQIQKHIAIQGTEVKSIEEARARVTELTLQRNKLDISTDKGKETLKQFNAEIDKHNEFIKENVDQYTKQKINIGNYTESIKDAIGQMGGFSGIIGQATTGVKTFGSIIKANPLSIILFGLSALVGWFSKTALGGAVLNKIMGTINGVFNSFGKLINDITSGKGFASFSNFFKNVSSDIEKAQNLKKFQANLENLDVVTSRYIAKQQIQLELNKKIADDDTKSWSERKKASLEAEKIQNEISQNEIFRNKQNLKSVQSEIELLKEKRQTQSQEYKDLEKQETELLIKQSEIQKEAAANEYDILQKRRMFKRDQFEKDLDAQIETLNNEKNLQQKIVDNEKLSINERQKALNEQKKLFIETTESELKLFEKYSGRKIDIVKLESIKNAQLQAEEISRQVNGDEKLQTRLIEILKERAAIKLELSENEIKLNESVATSALSKLENELAVFKLNNQLKESITKESYDRNIKLINDFAAKEIAIEDEKLKQNVNYVSEYELRIAEIKTNSLNEIAVAKDQFQQSELERQETNYQNQLALAQDNQFALIELERQKNEQMRLLEVENAKKIGADIELINKKYAKADLTLTKAKEKAKLELASQFTDNIATIFGESTAIGKAAAVASTAIKTYEGATAAYASLAGIPIVGPGLGAVAAAAAIAAGLANVKKILAINTDVSSSSSPSISGGSSGSSGSMSMPSFSTSAPQIGQGIAVRGTESTNSQMINEGIKNALNEITLQPVLVADDVTVAQNKDLVRKKVTSI